ncbi:MAG: hypothetical protein KAS32_17550 [Candidatus Peribacteraceae bacterium]|nr:hypothetical protein [Candidatus Peribacteraceae bacterium]
MSLTLSWDLLVIVFFAIVVTYSFIIGKHESVKIIIATYIAIVAALGLGNLLERLSSDSAPIFQMVGLTMDLSVLSTTKLILFIATIIFLAIRGGFDIEYSRDNGTLIDTLSTGVFGFVTAGLMLTTLLTFAADAPLLDKGLSSREPLLGIMQNSELMRIIIENQDVWFALPAIILIGFGFFNTENEQ